VSDLTSIPLDKPAAVIVDMDGTLSDATHRLHLIASKPKDWDRFFALCGEDGVHAHVGSAVNLFHQAYKVVIVTGRPARCIPDTVAWLKRHWIRHDALFSRADGDHRADDIVKEEILDRNILPAFTPIFAMDDRDRVVSMWRRRGIPCWQVAPGDF
jgi:hypothetical protein